MKIFFWNKTSSTKNKLYTNEMDKSKSEIKTTNTIDEQLPNNHCSSMVEYQMSSPFVSPLPSKDDPFLVKVRKIAYFLGPAWIVAMAYLDPGNLEGDLSVGALRDKEDRERGFRLLWVLFWATVIGYILQHIAIQLGIVTGQNLAALCHRCYPKCICYVTWIITELCLIGIDAQAVIGSAVAFTLLFNVPIYVGVIITLVDTFVILLVTLFGIQALEIIFGTVIALMGTCFYINMFKTQPSFVSIMKGITIPYIPQNTMSYAINLIGCVIMPHNFFLQTAVVQARPINRNDPKEVKQIIKIYSIETLVSLLISLAISVAVVSSFADLDLSLVQGKELTLNNAHLAISAVIGKMSSILWSLGLLSAGTCSTIAGTYCGQFVLEGLLNVRFKKLWLRMIVTRCISIVPVLGIILIEEDTVEAISKGVNIMQALWMPYILILLIKFSSSPYLMKKHQLSLKIKILAYIAAVLLTSANLVYFVITSLESSYLLLLCLIVYIPGLIYLLWRPLSFRDMEYEAQQCNSNKTLSICLSDVGGSDILPQDKQKESM